MAKLELPVGNTLKTPKPSVSLFTFPPTPPPVHLRPQKRPRALADVDGLDSAPRDCIKKRRLRLTSVSSNLSPPFASSSSSSFSREPTDAQLQTRQRSSTGMAMVEDKHVMRKAAIFNKIRLDAAAARVKQERQVEISRLAFREKVAAAKAEIEAAKKAEAEAGRRVCGGYQLRERKCKAVIKECKAAIKEKEKEKEKERGRERTRGRGERVKVNTGFECPMERRPLSPPDEEEVQRDRVKLWLGV